MKKIQILIGSPRKKGNTSILSGILVNSLDKTKFSTETCYLYDCEIKPCNDCRACKKDDMKCTVNDGMTGLYAMLEDSAVIIIGSPIYWSGPTAQTKLVLDRLRPYFSNKKLSGKKAALLLPAGDGESDCDLTIEMFKRSFKALGVDFLGAATAKAYDIGDVMKDHNAVEGVQRLINKIDKSCAA